MKKTNKKQRQIVRLLNEKNRKRKRKSVIKKGRKVETISFAEKFSLFVPKERERIAKMLYAIESGNCDKYYLDFSQVKFLNPLTALYIKHFLDKHPSAKFKCKNSVDIVPRSVFKLLGFNKHFGLKDVSNANYHPYVDDWHVSCGLNNDLPAETLERLVEIKDTFDDSNVSFKLINAIVEAISNVAQHAYINDETYKKWFLLTHIDKTNKSVTVVVSDLGASVPYTIPVTVNDRLKNLMDYGIVEFLKEIGFRVIPKNVNSPKDLESLTDSKLIRIATRLNSTRTNLNNRGKGFNDILGLSREAKDLKGVDSVVTTVLSRSGSYISKADINGDVKESSLEDGFKDFVSQIKGTVISWNIQMA